jgi:transcriptional regulator GlxA family with amidase domain
VSPHEYQTRIRLTAAARLLPTEKVEYVALAVGFRSKKNFYRAFRLAMGLSPSEFRRLAPESRCALVTARLSQEFRFSPR